MIRAGRREWWGNFMEQVMHDAIRLWRSVSAPHWESKPPGRGGRVCCVLVRATDGTKDPEVHRMALVVLRQCCAVVLHCDVQCDDM